MDQGFPCQSHAKHWHVAWSLSDFLLYFTLPDFRARHRRLTRIANSTYHGLCMTPTTLWTWPRTQKEFTAGRHEAFTNSRIISSTDHDFHSYSMGRSCKIVAPVGAITFIWHAEPIGLQVSAKGISSRTQSWDVHCAQGFKREPQDLKYTLCASHLLYKCAAKILSAQKKMADCCDVSWLHHRLRNGEIQLRDWRHDFDPQISIKIYMELHMILCETGLNVSPGL